VTDSLPPVLLLHGFATSADRTWRDNGWIDLLADMGRTVIAPDLLGHGSAPKPHDPAAYQDLGAPILAELPDEPVDAVGFSLGSRLLLGLAADQPERFRRLVITGAGANLFRNDGSGLVRQAIRGEADEANPVVRYFANLARDPGSDPAALEALLEGDTKRLTPEMLATVTCPTLVALGDRDFAGPPEPLVEALPNAQLVVLRGVDHFSTPKEFRLIDATLDFLGEP
jgi:pimeloyl-ACP methyl ester carboxylesterase